MRKDLGRKIVVVKRKTRLEELTEKFNTKSQARFYLRRSRENFAATAGKQIRSTGYSGGDDAYNDLEAEHETYTRELASLRDGVDFGLPAMVVDRAFLPTFLFGPDDIVVALGQDGLVANVAKYTIGLPIIAVNPDPSRFDGILLPYSVVTGISAINDVIKNRAIVRKVTLAEAVLNDGQRLLAFNDLFIGSRTHVSARYRIQSGERSEVQSSSGVLVSTGAGSTGWLSSIFNMATAVSGLARGAANQQRPRTTIAAWEDRKLIYVVREPFASKVSQVGMAIGSIPEGTELIIESHMPDHGAIFSDGIESDYIAFNSGAVARITVARQFATLVVPHVTASAQTTQRPTFRGRNIAPR